jgi:hypothetical protein
MLVDRFGSNGSCAPAAEEEDSQPMTDQRHGIADSSDWAMAIGRSIIAFARIEHSAALLVRQCTLEAVGHWAARLDLSARLAYIDKLLRYGGLPTQEERRWWHIYRKIEGLRAQHRTILAYGSPLPGPLEFTGRLVIIRDANGPQQSLLTLAQIEQAADEIGAAHGEFVRTATEIVTRLVAEDRLPLSAPPTTPDTAGRMAGTSRRNTDLPMPPADRRALVSQPQSGEPAGSGGS